MSEIKLNFTDFQKNKYVVRDSILAHIEDSNCDECTWVISIIGFNHLEEISNIKKRCLLKIYMELDLLGNVVETLKQEHGFEESEEFKPKEIRLNGAILIYCKEIKEG
ncbi:MAG: hypothetical protein WAQ28_00415 [Bacteroidia bacterium]